MYTHFPIIVSFGAGIAFVTLALSLSIGNSGFSSSPPVYAEEAVEVTISEGAALEGNVLNFEPAIIKIILGTNSTVRWINEDLTASSVVADDNSDPNFFDATQDASGNPTEQSFLLPGESFEYNFTRGGVFGYHSVPHPHMRGTVIVQQSILEDAAARVAKNKEIMAEAQSAFSKSMEEESKIFAYEEEKKNSSDELVIRDLNVKIQAGKAEIERLEKRLRELEQENIMLYQVEPALERRLYVAEKLLMDKYSDPSSGSYVGDNPVEWVHVDLLARTIVIMVNPDQVTPGGSNIPREAEIDGFPVNIEFGKFELI